MKQAQFLQLFVFILSLFLVESEQNPNLKTNSKKETLNKRPFIQREDQPKEYYDELVEKGRRLDNLTAGQPHYPFYEKMDYKADKKRRRDILKNFHKKDNKRRLSTEEQELENLGFIGLIQDRTTTSKYNRIMRYITNTVTKDDSKFILYPYPFEYTNKSKEVPETIKVNEGGVFTLNQTGLTQQTQYFQLIQNMSTVKIGKAKGIYDIDIAILSLTYKDSKEQEQDLFTDASRFCEYFTTQISKISTCLDGKNPYLEYKQKNPNKGAVVRVSAQDILNKTLYDPDTNQLKFKLLIISDYLTKNEQTIFSNKYLTNEAVNIIKKYRELGGNIISFGKSGYILELMGFIPSGTYDKDFSIGTNANKRENVIYGCQELYKESPEEQPDFLKQLICLGYKNRTVLSETYKMNSVPNNFKTLINYTNKEAKLFYKKDGYQYDITNKDETYEYILVSDEEQDKGRIFIVNGNPEENFYYFDNVRNMILYSMTKDYIYDLKIKFTTPNAGNTAEVEDDLPIPAGEEGVQLQVDYKFYNLYENPITNFKLEILFVNKVEVVDIPEGCLLKKEKATKFESLNLTEFNLDQYLLCQADSIQKLKSLGNKFKLEITHVSVTQRLIDIPLMYSSLSFKLNNKDMELNPGIFYAQAAIAALLRGTINKDPTSFYPMKGDGLYFDLVLTVENKENTLAKDVNFIALIPLITPLVDGDDEGLIAHLVPVYENYYRKHDYHYPWTDLLHREHDYIDYAEVAGKGVCFVNDYDTPVKLTRMQRDDPEVIITNKYELTANVEMDENAGADKGITPNSLLKQIYYADSESFYETAAPRTSLFIDTATEVGAQAYYEGDSIPNEEIDKDNNNVAKVHLGFIRVDTFFYNSIFNQYQYPNGFNDSVLISLDHFEQNEAPILDKKIGEIKAELKVTGYYDSTKARYQTLKPNEYFNPLRQYKSKTQYDPTKEEDLKKLQELTTDKIKLSHFMVPNKEEKIKRAENIYGFKENEDQLSGYFEEYPSLKFIYAHSIELVLDPEITRLGGIAEIILPDDVRFVESDPVEKDRITTSADNVAFYKNEYIEEKGIIKLYFKRGLMPNENYGLPSKCEVFLEELNKKDNFTVTLNIYELKYDFSSDTLESFYKVEKATKNNLLSVYKSFYSFPCLYLENTVSRKSTFSEEPSSDMYEYELMNPFARYGGFFQELTKHTTVFASSEAHHRTDPGFQGIPHGFSLISNIGTSSIPFAEFLNHATLAIPGVTTTSRLEWTDIWGRKWAQNLRSVYPDIPVLPPVPLNFIMTTTFELITNTKNPKDQTRVIEWQSDESVYVRIQMKMRNTYKLYWEPTLCLNNQKPIIKTNNNDYRNPIFVDPDKVETVDPSIGDEWDVNLGFSSVYGVCYNESSYIGGQKVTQHIKTRIQEMMTCAATLDPEAMTNCSLQAEAEGLPKIKRRPATVTDEQDTTPNDTWNYSPLIEEYLPDGYISNHLMWQLNMPEYSDDQFFKGYPWHLDDCIPNLDNSILKPHDIIAFPLLKGLGYNLTYDKNYSLYKFPDYKGWWSDQLQNKDHTLIAGQQKVSQVAVGHESLLKDSDWISAFKLKQKPEKRNVIDDRLKNLYVCMFNRHRVKVTPGQKKYAFLKNVYQNNVIPILPDLKEDDERYDKYQCKENEPQYSIYNISQVDNRVYTNNDRDWLYFAAGLRSYAMEDINVIMKLDPIESSKFEGITKIQDGGRFTYWQPPDGPNSYQYYDGNINTVIGKRVDLAILGKLIPSQINTFNTYLYELFEISDDKELNRTYTMNTYMNSHGFGDATTTVYVGGVDSTSCRVEPGTFTYVKIVFYNNAGFDWKMKKGAIELNDTEYGKIYTNAMSMLLGILTAVQFPSKYNFMEAEIPEEIAPYVTLTPSQHVMDLSPQFWDLTFNNILTIRDALEGDYFYCLNVSDKFPKELEGKFWEIKLKLNESWFETLPSVNDPTGIHDYHLTIPSIRFGVPISEGENKGKIFYNLGQAKNMVYTFRLYKEFEIKGIKLINENIKDQINDAITNSEDMNNKLLELWDKIPSNEDIIDRINISSKLDSNTFYNLHTFNLTEAFPLFPYEEAPNKPFVSKLYLFVKSYSPHSPFGNKDLMTSTRINYNDGRKNKNAYADPSYIRIYSAGPHLAPGFDHKIVELNETTLEFVVTDRQEIYNGDSLIIKLTLTAKNEGTKSAFKAKFNLKIDNNTVYIEKNQTTQAFVVTEGEITEDGKMINILYNGEIRANDERKCDLYFKMQFGEKKRQNNTDEEIQRRNLADKTSQVSLVKELDMSLCLIDKDCQEGDINYGKQISDVKHSISYKTDIVRAIGRISLTAKNIGTDSKPKYKLEATVSDVDSKYNISNVIYIYYRKIEGIDDDFREIGRSNEPTFIDEPFANMNDMTNYKVTYKVIGRFSDGRTLDSMDDENIFEHSYKLVEDKKGFPAYAIALIVILGAALLAAGAFLIYKLLTRKGAGMAALAVSENPEIVKKFAGEIEKGDNTATSTTTTRKRRIQNKIVLSGENNKQ